MRKNNITKIPMGEILLRRPKHICKTCKNDSTILYNEVCPKCLKLTPLEDFQ